jgi:hypothetical protein
VGIAACHARFIIQGNDEPGFFLPNNQLLQPVTVACCAESTRVRRKYAALKNNCRLQKFALLQLNAQKSIINIW